MEKDIALYREKLQRYYTGGKLAQYPQKRPMRILALSRIAQRFEPARQYAEKEVNEIIKEAIAFPDVELVRRELYEYRFLGRRRDGSAYWPEAYGAYIENE